MPLEALNGRRFAASNAIVKKLLETHPNNIGLHAESDRGRRWLLVIVEVIES